MGGEERLKITDYLGGGVHMIDLLLWFKSHILKQLQLINNICTKSMKIKLMILLFLF